MNQEDHEFDFSTALKAIQEGKPLLGREGILTPLIKNLTEAALEGELDSHLGREITANRRNGKSRKTIKSLNGNFELRTPRDRDGTFSPQLVKKHHTTARREYSGFYRTGIADESRRSDASIQYLARSGVPVYSRRRICSTPEACIAPLQAVFPLCRSSPGTRIACAIEHA